MTNFLKSFQRFPIQEKIVFFRNLAVMVHAGVSVLYALECLRQQVTVSVVNDALGQITDDIKNGQRLSVAFARHPKLFPSLIFETIRVGESAGELSKALERIAANLEYSYELRRRVIGALTYPFIVVLVLVAVMVGLVWFVFPKLSQLYRDLHAPLPLFTRMLMSTGQFFRESALYIISGVVLIVLIMAWAYRKETFRHYLHKALLKVPIFGQLVADLNAAQFFRHLETLLGSGLPLVQGVHIANRTVRNTVYKKAIDDINNILLSGTPFSVAIKKYPALFSSQLQLIIEVGERSGKLTSSAAYITAYYERSIAYKTQMLSSLLEPVLMIIIGIVIGCLALAVFLPIYQISNVIQ